MLGYKNQQKEIKKSTQRSSFTYQLSRSIAIIIFMIPVIVYVYYKTMAFVFIYSWWIYTKIIRRVQLKHFLRQAHWRDTYVAVFHTNKNKQTWGQFRWCSNGFSKCRSVFRNFKSWACARARCKWRTPASLCRQLRHGLPVQISLQCSTRHFLLRPTDGLCLLDFAWYF